MDPAGGDLHRILFHDAEIGLVVIEVATDLIRDANPFLCALLGHAAGSLAGRSLSVVGEGANSVPAGIRRWQRADGSRIDVRVRVSDGTRGKALQTLVVDAVDADELVRAEENRAALTAAGLGEWRLDFAKGLVTLSRRTAHILGYPLGAAVTWASLKKLLDPAEAVRIRAQVRATVLDGRPLSLECRLRRAVDGVEISIGVRGQVIAASAGRPTGVVGVIQDVTTRVQARNALRDGEQRLRIATSLAALGIFEWHMLDDHAIWENERMFAIFGREASDGAVGKREFLENVVHPDDRAGFRSAILTALKEDTTLQATGRIRRKSDGAWRTIDLAGRFERDATNRLPRRLIGVVADVTERRVAEERQTLLIRELHHRVKNTLATVQAIVGSTARTASSIESFYEAFVGRIMSLAHTHSVLTEDTWQTASLRTLLANELKPYADGALEEDTDARIQLEGPPVDMSSEIAVPIGMAIHELTTNAAKYGALSTPEGRVAITWSLEPGGPAGTLRFAWVESRGPVVHPPTRQGFGSRLLQRVLTAQVRAEVAMTYAPDGFRLTMLAPLPERNDALNPLA
ncbi:PAS domain-containing protein [Methylobacterium sp. BTF04]|uniref:sensor histidine kinase n=1 Tax=Methylobacterium sp. BTF04 TaxID=2708300 RepID=UPI0013D1E830|nr:HWE histidine kinase domain-containing protein [Methylobacterium sp. BTF04]NEU10676.1 PAS domain-containing protein [Methylobacterium sp. BTF04]